MTMVEAAEPIREEKEHLAMAERRERLSHVSTVSNSSRQPVGDVAEQHRVDSIGTEWKRQLRLTRMDGMVRCQGAVDYPKL